MSAREVIFLGTASQVPTRARSHNSLFLRWDDLGILFDPGEGTQRQMALAGLASHQITHVAITHFHGDHCLGLPGVVQRISLDRVPHPVHVIFPRSGQIYFERMRQACIFHDQAILAPLPVEGTGEIPVGRFGSFRVIAHPLEHGIDCFGYRLQEDDGRRMIAPALEEAGIRGAAVGALMRQGELSVGGQKIRLEDVSEPRPGQAFALVMDTRPCEGASRLAQGVDLLVSESTFLESEAEEARIAGHMTAAQAARLAKEAGVRRLALTHFSQRYTAAEPFVLEASAIHDDVVLAEDLATVAVPKRRDQASAP